MILKRIEDCFINPEQVVIVRKADPNDLGYQTEVILANGSQMFKASVMDVALALGSFQ